MSLAMEKTLETPTRALGRRWRRYLCVLAALGSACDSKSPTPSAAEAQPAAAPDRLQGDERLPESEAAFGLSLPAGMRLTRHFNDSAYFLGKLDQTGVLVHLKSQLSPSNVEMMGRRAVFLRTQVKGGDPERWLRIEVWTEGTGTQVYLQDITPPPTPKGVTESQMWSRAGRNPDGTPKDENHAY
jgi:hypothetical protein